MTFYYFTPSDDSDEGDSSDSVSDAWSDMEEEGDSRHVSREAQEAAIQEQFNEAVDALRNFNQQKSLRILTDIFLSSTMQEFYIANWRDFDWEAAAEKSQRTLSNMAKVYFSVCMGLAGLVEDSVTFYMQALSIYPKLTDVWFACGKDAAKNGDFSTAQFCFEHCGTEFRAFEALLLLHYVNDELHKCVDYLGKIFERCEDHYLASVIRAEIAQRDALLCDTFMDLRFPRNIVPEKIRDDVLSKIASFRSSKPSQKKDDLMELITSSKRPYAPLVLVLQRDTKMEELGKTLCNTYLRIEMFSSLAEQLIHIKESVPNVPEPSSYEPMDAIATTTTAVEDPVNCEFTICSPSMPEEQIVLNEIVDAVCLEVEMEEEAKRKRLQKKKAISHKKAAIAKSVRGDAVEGLLNDDEFTRRRSTRFVEDVETNSVNDEAARVATFWSYMNVNDDFIEKMFPFVFASSSEPSKSIFDRRSSAPPPPSSSLPSFEPLISGFFAHFAKNSAKIEHLLFKFLQFCATHDSCNDCVFSEDQARVFRSVYTYWCRTFTDNVFTVIPIEELYIHTLAAELGSPLAFSILRTHFSLSLKYDRKEFGVVTTSNKEEVSKRRMLFNRYLWLLCNSDGGALGFVANAPEFVLFRFTSLTLLAQTLGCDEQICTRISSALSTSSNKNTTCLIDVCAILYNEARKLYAKQVHRLQEMEDYEELFTVLLNYYNYAQDDEETQLDMIFLLTKCALKTSRFDFALSVILAILQKLRNKVFSSAAISKRALLRSLELLEDVDLKLLDEKTLCAFGKSLAELVLLSDNELFHGCVGVWVQCYRIAKFRESITPESLDEFYSQSNENSLPTRALMVLMHAHDVIGRMHKCWKKNGMILRLFLEEMFMAMSNPIVQQQIEKFGDFGVLIKRNVALEAFQCLVCVFSESLVKIRNHYDDHGSIQRFDWECDWTLAEIVLPLIMPRILPEFSSLEKISNYFAEVISRVFPFVLDVSPKALERFQKFSSNPPGMELKEVFDEDGLTSYFAEEYAIEGTDDPRKILYGFDYQENAGFEDLERNRLYLASKCLYALSIYHYRNNNSEEALRTVRSCLAICGPHLDDGLQSSAWFIYARCVTNNYSMLQDAELLKTVDEFLLPFKMTIFLKKHSCDAHLDLAAIIYQIRSRIKRFTKKSFATDEQKKIYHRKIEGMIPKCRTHFELAKRYNDSDAEIPWLSAYFLAKIAEKLGNTQDKVFKWYYDCVVAMENEGYQYPQKINRSKQTNFEPLEIHYKVHAYAYKQLDLLTAARFSAIRSKPILDKLKYLYANLKRFSYHAIEQKGLSKPEFYVSDCTELLKDSEFGSLKSVEVFKSAPSSDPAQNNNNDEEMCNIVSETVSDMVDFTELRIGILELCDQAFETIIAKFPHYKACYRIAESQYRRGKFRQCADTLFHRLFFNAKKRLTPGSNIFENIVEISRADIERSGSFPYHIYKIIDLSIVTCYKSHAIDRLVVILHSLLTLKNKENVPDMLDESSLAILRQKCITAVIGLMNALKTSQSLSQACFQLNDLMRKMSRENISEAKLLEVAYSNLIQKRNCIEQQHQQRLNQQRIASQLLVASKRSAVDVPVEADQNSPTNAKQPRLIAPGSSAMPTIAALPQQASTFSQQQPQKKLFGDTKVFADFLDSQLQKLTPANRQRVISDLQQAAARTDQATQKELMFKFMEKICQMTKQQQLRQNPPQQASTQISQQQQLPTPSTQGPAIQPPIQQSQCTKPNILQQRTSHHIFSKKIGIQPPRVDSGVEEQQQRPSMLTGRLPFQTPSTTQKIIHQQHQQSSNMIQNQVARTSTSQLPPTTKPVGIYQHQSMFQSNIPQNMKFNAASQVQTSKPIGIQQNQCTSSNAGFNVASLTSTNQPMSTMTVRQHLQQISDKNMQTSAAKQQPKNPPVKTTTPQRSPISRPQGKPAVGANNISATLSNLSKITASNPQHQSQLIQLKQQLEALAKQNTSLSNSNKTPPFAQLQQQKQQMPTASAQTQSPLSSAKPTKIINSTERSTTANSSVNKQINQSRYSLPSNIQSTAINSSPSVSIPPTTFSSPSPVRSSVAEPGTPKLQGRGQSALSTASSSPSCSIAAIMSTPPLSRTTADRHGAMNQLPTTTAGLNQIQKESQPKLNQSNQQKNGSDFKINTLTPQQQYLYSLYLSSLQKKEETVNKAVNSSSETINQRQRTTSEDDIIVVSQKGPSVRSTQASNAPVTSQNVHPLLPPQLQIQQQSRDLSQLNQWAEQLKNVFSAGLAPPPHQQQHK